MYALEKKVADASCLLHAWENAQLKLNKLLSYFHVKVDINVNLLVLSHYRVESTRQTDVARNLYLTGLSESAVVLKMPCALSSLNSCRLPVLTNLQSRISETSMY